MQKRELGETTGVTNSRNQKGDEKKAHPSGRRIEANRTPSGAFKNGLSRKANQGVCSQSIKRTEQIIKRIERATGSARLKWLSLEECRRRYYNRDTPRRQQEAEIER
jgi:hypothetical protein